jgi:hypothetical protein
MTVINNVVMGHSFLTNISDGFSISLRKINYNYNSDILIIIFMRENEQVNLSALTMTSPLNLS